MPGGCCYGNASAIAMIAHSCLINWFFNASWFVRTLKVHGKWKINGFPSLSPFFLSFLVLPLILLKLFPHVLRSVLTVFWIAIGSWRLPWMGEVRDRLFEMQKEYLLLHGFLLWAAAEANTESNVMRILGVFKAGQSLAQRYFVVHFYSSNLLGPIMIREPSLHLWTSTRFYQDLICLGPPIWSFEHFTNA